MIRTSKPAFRGRRFGLLQFNESRLVVHTHVPLSLSPSSTV